MNLRILERLRKKLFFGMEDVAELYGITPAAARLKCYRYEKEGIITRLKRNFYVFSDKLESMSSEELFTVANFLYVPSYISLTTALSFYGITTQVQQAYIESVTYNRSNEFLSSGIAFKYFKIKKAFYNDFIKRNSVFIATPEKAFIDAVYLCSLGKYSFDVYAIDFSKLDRTKIENTIKNYPKQTQTVLKKCMS